MDEFGVEFDFCFLDAAHRLPGEILDYLAVLPFMKKGALLVVHDISLSTIKVLNKYNFGSAHNHACTLLFCLVCEPKLLPVSTSLPKHDIREYVFPNIGAIRIDNGKEAPYIDDLFRGLTLPWSFVPDQKSYQEIVEHFSKHYREDQVEMFQKTYAYQSGLMKQFRIRNFRKRVFRKAYRTVMKHLKQIRNLVFTKR